MTYLQQRDVAWQFLVALAAREDCSDNFRIGLKDDPYDEMIYQQSKESGCCGFCDTEVYIDGEFWRIGFNYGH